METEGSGGAAIAGGTVGAIIAAIGNVGIPTGIVMTGIFAVAAAVAWTVYSTVVAKRKAAKTQEEYYRFTEETERRQKENAISSASYGAKTSATESVAAFRRMSDLLGEMDARILEARRCRVDSAFSPYWSAIEQAYVAAGGYRDCVATIEWRSKEYASAVSEYARLGGNPLPFAQFPVTLNGGEVESAIKQRLDVLGPMVYDAQKDPTFAYIWEQRRTTAAVIRGFANLEAAVNGMRRSIEASFEALSTTTRQSQAQVSAAVDRLTVSSSAASQSLSTDMAALSHTAAKIYDETFLQGHGRYPLI